MALLTSDGQQCCGKWYHGNGHHYIVSTSVLPRAAINKQRRRHVASAATNVATTQVPRRWVVSFLFSPYSVRYIYKAGWWGLYISTTVLTIHIHACTRCAVLSCAMMPLCRMWQHSLAWHTSSNGSMGMYVRRLPLQWSGRGMRNGVG